MAISLQDRLKQRRSSTFVGREQQLEMFRQNIIRPLDSEDCYFIFSIHGQGGVGKTELLKKYNAIAKEHNALAAYIDEDTKDLPEMLADFARQLKEQNAPLNEFDERYKTYLQEKKRLEADPEAPKGAWNFGARFLARSAKSLAKELVPGAGLVTEYIDADALGDQLGEWAAFVAKKLTNKDEVQLLIEPVETLTPLFLKGLGKYQKHLRICLFFDTFEETGRFADEWLRHLLNGKYGDAPENLLSVVAGRDPLDPNLWSNFGDFITTVALEEFSEIEAKTYLERKNITSPSIVETILELSGRLPVLLATLAEAAPDSPDEVSDPNATAVSRFLKWISDPVQRRLALHAALPRRLNQDIIQCLLPEGADAELFFNWLCSQPFVKRQKGGYWSYHSIVRDLMQRYQFQLSPDTWSSIHSQLAAYYDKRAADLGIEGREKCFQHDEWLSFRLESGFHRLSAAYTKELPNAVADWVTVFRLKGMNHAILWGENVVQTGAIWGNTEMGGLFRAGSAALLALELEKALPLIVKISGDFSLTVPEDRAFIKRIEGMLHVSTGNYEVGIKCLENVVNAKPNDADTWYIMGIAYSSIVKYEDALMCYQNAIELNPYDITVRKNMGLVYGFLDEYEKAIKAYEKAIEINDNDEVIWNNMGVTYFNLGEKEKAVECYKKATQIKNDYYAAWGNMGDAYTSLGLKNEALECSEKSIDPQKGIDVRWYYMNNGYDGLPPISESVINKLLHPQ